MDILRQIVASPRARHPDAGLDLCYVTPNIIATSGPSGTYPQVAYRNPLRDLVRFLDSRHGVDWAIWEFRAEGTGYPDDEVYGRVRHYPWPDHHPPPFRVVPLIMGSMRNWLKGEGEEGTAETTMDGAAVASAEGRKETREENGVNGKETEAAKAAEGQKGGRVAVVHCKAGKGRSGTVACSYLISQEGWSKEDAMKRFTERRMRPGFGPGVSIPSQVRYLGYVDRWTRFGKKYTERAVEVTEVHVWGLRDGVKVAIEGYVEEGKVIKTFHTFQKSEREVVRGSIKKGSGLADVALEIMGKKQAKPTDPEKQIKASGDASADDVADASPSGEVIFRPSTRVVVPSSDVNLDFERRNKSKYGGFTVVTSVAHVWFNIFFEGNGPEKHGKPDDSGVFEIDFDAMDGIKGSIRKGTRAFDRVAVVWKAVDSERDAGILIQEPPLGEEVDQVQAADWRGNTDAKSEDFEKKLGLRATTSDSASISRASSQHTNNKDHSSAVKDERDTVQSRGPDGQALEAALTSHLAPAASAPETVGETSKS